MMIDVLLVYVAAVGHVWGTGCLTRRSGKMSSHRLQHVLLPLEEESGSREG